MAGYFTKMVSLGYEELLLFHDSPSGLKAIIAIHSTALGPALGGTRMFNSVSYTHLRRGRSPGSGRGH